MANFKPPEFLLLLLFFAVIFSYHVAHGSRTTQPPLATQQRFSHSPTSRFKNVVGEERMRMKKINSRRLMIGSTAPTCTYNECRGCKYRCRAEQVPVEGNDPMNSAYHFRCVCHR